MINRIKKSFTAIPATVAEAVSYIISIAEKQKEINAIKKDASVRIRAIKTEVELKVTPLTKERDIFFTALYTFAMKNKAELTKKLRSVKTHAGTFGWRWTPPAVALEEGKTEGEILTLLESSGLNQYIRVIKEIDREALLRDRPEIPGIYYDQREEFFAKPKMKKEEGSAEELVKSTEAIDV